MREEKRRSMRIYVHPRVMVRHPQLTKDDVISAFHSTYKEAERDTEPASWVCIGLDSRGRDVEIVYTKQGDDILIYHALTPPTDKILRELRMI